MQQQSEKYVHHDRGFLREFLAEDDRKRRAPVASFRKTRAEIYAFVRNPNNLARFIVGLESVVETEPGRWTWAFKGANGERREWRSELIADDADELIAWRTVGPTDEGDLGVIALRDDPSGRGAVVALKLGLDEENPGKFFGVTSQLALGGQAKSYSFINLRRLKALMETGEVPTTEGQPNGNDHASH